MSHKKRREIVKRIRDQRASSGQAETQTAAEPAEGGSDGAMPAYAKDDEAFIEDNLSVVPRHTIFLKSFK